MDQVYCKSSFLQVYICQRNKICWIIFWVKHLKRDGALVFLINKNQPKGWLICLAHPSSLKLTWKGTVYALFAY